MLPAPLQKPRTNSALEPVFGPSVRRSTRQCVIMAAHLHNRCRGIVPSSIHSSHNEVSHAAGSGQESRKKLMSIAAMFPTRGPAKDGLWDSGASEAVPLCSSSPLITLSAAPDVQQ